MEPNGAAESPSPAQRDSFVELLEWTLASAGGSRRLLQDRVVSAETLRRWRDGQVPVRRSSPAVEALESWARENVAEYPPDWAPTGGFIALSGPRTDKPQVRPLAATLIPSSPEPADPPEPATDSSPLRQRRVLMGAGAAVLALLGLGGAWLFTAGGGAENQGARIEEIAGNRKGSPVFADPSGAPVPATIPTRIPYGTAVSVACFAPNTSGMTSVSGFYLIDGGTWNGTYVVADTMTNGGTLGDASSPNVDLRVPACGT